MEFSWRMATTLVWPLIALVGIIVFRKWIIQSSNFRFKVGSVELELNTKVEKTGQDIALALSAMPVEPAEGEIPKSLVDLLPMVSRNRDRSIRTSFRIVRRALDHYYPQLTSVGSAQLKDAVLELADKGQLDPDVAESVKKLQELLAMPEWDSDPVGDTRAYAFLMLAEGAIHGIIRSARVHGQGAGGEPPIAESWKGTYYGTKLSIELSILNWGGQTFTGEMTYPDRGHVTRVSGQVDGDGVTWTETTYKQRGTGPAVELGGTYRATLVSGETMRGDWYRTGVEFLGSFEMTATRSSG
jgi:hypothetical protein